MKTELLWRKGYASSSTDEDPDELGDENLAAVHPVDEEPASADA